MISIHYFVHIGENFVDRWRTSAHDAQILFFSPTHCIWWKMFYLSSCFFLSLKRWFQFNSGIVGTHFAGVVTLNDLEMITETRSYIFRWHFRCRLRRVCLSYLLHERLRKNIQNKVLHNPFKYIVVDKFSCFTLLFLSEGKKPMKLWSFFLA